MLHSSNTIHPKRVGARTSAVCRAPTYHHIFSPFSSSRYLLLVSEHDESSVFGFDDQVISHIHGRAFQSIEQKVNTVFVCSIIHFQHIATAW